MIYPPSEINKQPNYNAVKIQINDPKTRISPEYKTNPDDKGIYTGVDIQINRPTVEPYTKPVYDYPIYNEIIPFDLAVPVAKLPVAYQTNLFNNKTFIHNNNDYEIEFELKKPEEKSDVTNSSEPQGEIEEAVIIEEIETPETEAPQAEPEVPQANYTTVEAEKENALNFHGINFQAKKEPKIIPSEEILPEVDIPVIVKKLHNPDFDIQAQQMEEIARISMENPADAVPYIVRDVFSSLIDIVKKDTSDLNPPSQQQTEIRRKIIINEIIKEQARENKQDLSKLELPYQISEEEIKLANEISPLEQAERNKEYALYTMAVLAKVYTDEVEKQTGNVVPLTDLPGISTVVDTLRYNSNPSIKIAAIDSLLYIQRPEYKEELTSLFNLIAKDRNDYVAESAAAALLRLNEQK